MAFKQQRIELWLVLERGILNTEAICVAAEAAGPADVKSRSAISLRPLPSETSTPTRVGLKHRHPALGLGVCVILAQD